MAEKEGHHHHHGIPTEYPPLTEKDFDDFATFADSQGPEWREQYASKDGKIKVWDRHVEGYAVNMVRVVAVLEVPALVLYDTLHDADYRKMWDDNMVEGYNIEVIDQNNDVGYYSAKSPVFGVSGRDFCNERSWRIKDDTEYMIINHSVIHPKCPEKKGFVRANSIRSGYMMRVRDETSCVLTYITHTDPKGSIPAMVMNFMTKTFAPKILHKIETAAKAYMPWKEKHNPGVFVWRGVGGTLPVGLAPDFQ